MSKTYYIFRHGETFATKSKRWYWNKLYSATILEEGKPSVIRLANYLTKIKTDYNVSSPFLRCRQTVELVEQATGKKFEFDPKLGDRTIEFSWNYKKRVLNFIEDMEKSKHQNILICTHAAVIRELVRYLTKDSLTFKEDLVAPFPGVLTIIKNKQIKEIDFNKI